MERLLSIRSDGYGTIDLYDEMAEEVIASRKLDTADNEEFFEVAHEFLKTAEESIYP